MFVYNCKGTCSKQIKFDIVDGKVTACEFVGGCNGNTKGIAKLVEGMEASRVIEILKGNTCGPRATSCPDQLATALEIALAEQA